MTYYTALAAHAAGYLILTIMTIIYVYTTCLFLFSIE
jgi:hypothetical protein